ncbi:sensor histidine kinase [Marisediminicola sp. LYQ134]|uniref:sensor histidine kinase n=1 Tax=Marisediminicola sp. LYQ134 TaxID=3391061 RepID=UPI003983B441
MNQWAAENSTLVASVAAGLAVVALALAIAWALSLRNARLLSRELDEQDAELARLRTVVAEHSARSRIVLELHEVAVHSVASIVRTADGARYSAAADDGAAVRALGQIVDEASSSLSDLRRIVAISGPDAQPERPTVTSMADLIDSMRHAGLDITFVESGESFPLRSGADAAVCRILEEALSNALTHGGAGTAVSVTVTWTAEGVQLLVDDDGVHSAARRDGLDPYSVSQRRRYSIDDDAAALTEVVSGPGVTEMRERATAFDGVFSAYPVPGVGFSVSAIFPRLRHDGPAPRA